MTAKAPEPAQPAASTGTPATTAPVAAPPAAAATPAPVTTQAPKAAAPVKAPAKPPVKAKPPKSSAGVAGGAFVVAVCALLVAIGAIAVSIYSLKVARDALSKNADRAQAAAPAATTNPTTAAPAAPAPTTNPSANAPRVQYFSELQKAEIKVPGPSGCNAQYVDVDTLAVGSFTGHEFYLTNCVDPFAVRVDRSSGASSSSANPTAEQCGSLLTGNPGTPELVLPIRSGLTFCMLTNKTDAMAQNLPQRLAVVEVRDVAADKTVTLAVSTYRIL